MGGFPAQLMADFAPPTVPTNGDAPYQTVDNAHVDYADQGNHLTPSQDTRLPGHVQILQKRDLLHDAFGGFVHADPDPQVKRLPSQVPDRPLGTSPAQLEGEHVRVTLQDANNPVVQNDKGKITGDPRVIESYTTADRVYHTAANYLGRDFTFANGRKLTVALGDPRAGLGGPQELGGQARVALPDVLNGGDPAAVDPDVVAHESGHAVLDSQRPEYSQTPGNSPVHEGFADSTALIQALQNPDVRRDTIDKWKHGQESTLAGNIGEGYNQWIQQNAPAPANPLGAPNPLDPPTTQPSDKCPPPATQPTTQPAPKKDVGLRDLGGPLPSDDEQAKDPHAASQRLSSSVFGAIHAKYDQIRQAQPNLSEDDALKQATDSVGSDVTRATDFLPAGSVTMNDFAHAMVKANGIDQKGANSAIYSKAFSDHGLSTGGMDAMLKDLGTTALGSNPQLTLPAALRQAPDFKAVPNHGAAPPAAAAAEKYLQDHGAAYGIDKPGDLHAQRLYHNNRGETFISYSDGKSMGDGQRVLHAGYDRDGKLLFISEGKVTPPPPLVLPGDTNQPIPFPH